MIALNPKELYRFEVRVCEEIFAKRSLRSWWYFGRECFCFGRELVNASGETVIVRGLLNSLAGEARELKEYGGSAACPPTNLASYAGYFSGK